MGNVKEEMAMLKRFNVKNVYSFAAREDGRSEEFSMIAGKVRSKKDHIYDDQRNDHQ